MPDALQLSDTDQQFALKLASVGSGERFAIRDERRGVKDAFTIRCCKAGVSR